MAETNKNGVASWLDEYYHLTWGISEGKYFPYDFPENMAGPEYYPSYSPRYLYGKSSDIIAVHMDNTIRIMDTITGKNLYSLPYYSKESHFTFSGNDQYLLVIENDGQLKLWDLEEKKIVSAYSTDYHSIAKIKIDENCRWVAVWEGNSSRGQPGRTSLPKNCHIYTLDEQLQFHPYADLRARDIDFNSREVLVANGYTKLYTIEELTDRARYLLEEHLYD